MFNLTPKQTPQEYAEAIKSSLGSRLVSLVLYGSAVTGEHNTRHSDYNLMVVVEHWGILELNLIAKITRRWLLDGNPPPLLFTLARLQSSADCFPIEMLDIKQSYKILHGADVIKDLKVPPTFLRLIVEREVKSLNIQLRQSFIFAEGKPEKVAKLLVNTRTSMLVLMRAALRLYTSGIPVNKDEVAPALAEHIKGIDTEAFQTIYQLKQGQLKAQGLNVLQLFERISNSLMAVSTAVDDHRLNA